jgi:hypothetical protein
VWSGRTLASAVVLLCALLADHARPTDASVAAPAYGTFTSRIAVKGPSDFSGFNVAIGGTPRAGAVAANGYGGSSSESALAGASTASAVAGANNRQRVFLIRVVIADAARFAAFFA